MEVLKNDEVEVQILKKTGGVVISSDICDKCIKKGRTGIEK